MNRSMTSSRLCQSIKYTAYEKPEVAHKFPKRATLTLILDPYQQLPAEHRGFFHHFVIFFFFT